MCSCVCVCVCVVCSCVCVCVCVCLCLCRCSGLPLVVAALLGHSKMSPPGLLFRHSPSDLPNRWSLFGHPSQWSPLGLLSPLSHRTLLQGLPALGPPPCRAECLQPRPTRPLLLSPHLHPSLRCKGNGLLEKKHSANLQVIVSSPCRVSLQLLRTSLLRHCHLLPASQQ